MGKIWLGLGILSLLISVICSWDETCNVKLIGGRANLPVDEKLNLSSTFAVMVYRRMPGNSEMRIMLCTWMNGIFSKCSVDNKGYYFTGLEDHQFCIGINTTNGTQGEFRLSVPSDGINDTRCNITRQAGSEKSRENKTPAIVSGVVGAIFVVAFLAFLIYMYRRRRNSDGFSLDRNVPKAVPENGILPIHYKPLANGFFDKS